MKVTADELKSEPEARAASEAEAAENHSLARLSGALCSLSDVALNRLIRTLPGYKLKIIEAALAAVVPARADNPVLNPWVRGLSFMQQSVLMSAVRNADGVAKKHKSKALIRWYRRCILLSAFDGRELTDPREDGGGSFTGPVANVATALDDFIDSRDEMSLHYFAHAMHAFEILGYKHPDHSTRAFWHEAYLRMAHALHVWPETVEQMDSRLGDNESGWRERNDPSTTCSD